MAKAKKTATQSEPITAKEIIQNEPTVAETLDVAEETVEVGRTTLDPHSPVETIVMSKSEATALHLVESDEIKFLRKLLHIQDAGGWGKHLHPMIEERIAELKK